MDGNEQQKKEFSVLYKTLPSHSRISPSLAQNLSAPIAFVTLLHLANENVSFGSSVPVSVF